MFVISKDMGYRGKLSEQQAARQLRGQGWTLSDIADRLGVARSSVSVWVRDVEFETAPRRRARRRGPNALQQRKAAEIDALRHEGVARMGVLGRQAFLAAGAALYAGEGSKRDGAVHFANSDPRLVAFFCSWLRAFFSVTESRLRVSVYLHEGLDLDAAQSHWAQVTGIPPSQFRQGYRAVADGSIRTNKHAYGCAYVIYNCSKTHRAIMGLVDALLSSSSYSGVAQSAERVAVNH
jgi:Homeodomain-like domain